MALSLAMSTPYVAVTLLIIAAVDLLTLGFAIFIGMLFVIMVIGPTRTGDRRAEWNNQEG